MDFKTWLEAFEKSNYKKNRKNPITKINISTKAVNPSNLSKPSIDNPSGTTYNGINIDGPDYKTIAKIHTPLKNKTKHLNDPYKWTQFGDK